MKHEKVISFTLINAFCLLGFASLLASCQKNKFQLQGHYTQFKTAREPASQKKSSLEKHIDLKQIVLFCQVNSSKHSLCFKQNFKQQVRKLKEQGKIAKQINFEQSDYYKKHLESVSLITDKILNSLEDKIDFFVQKKKDFCHKNAKKDAKKCLKNTKMADTVHILNSYQQKQSYLNGHEYLYLKRKIEEKMDNKLDAAFIDLKKGQKKNLSLFIKMKSSAYESYLSEKKDAWPYKAQDAGQAVSLCEKQAVKSFHYKSPYFTQVEVKKAWGDEFCVPFIEKPHVLALINNNFNESFESAIKEISGTVAKKISLSKKACSKDLKVKKDQCYKKQISLVIKNSVNEWVAKNPQQKNKKDLFLQRLSAKKKTFVRSIASE